MAYNLPPAWDPGFALPDNVRDEGLERRGFVTKQMPRGTYDMPKVGSGGYVLPPNVQAEGYGQGTYTTKWLPRGYYDVKVPHWLNQRPLLLSDSRLPGSRRGRKAVMAAPIMVQPDNQGTAVAVSGLGDDLPPVFTRYGQRAADILIRSVAGLPQPAAKAKLKQIMDAVDPTLWGRTAQLTRGYMDQGLQGWDALRAGLATAMSAGIAAEIIRTGLSRTAPQARSLLGLGCYGCAAALGATPAAAAPFAFGFQAVSMNTAPVLQVGPWSLPVASGAKTTIPAAAMSPEQKTAFATGLARASAAILAVKMAGLGLSAPSGAMLVDLGATGLGSGKAPKEILTGMHINKFKHPTTGVTAYLYAKSVGTKAQPAVQLWWNEDKSLVASIVAALVELIATIVTSVIAPILDAVGGAACELLGSSGATIAGAAAATAAGVPPQAGAQGVAIAQQACSQPPPQQQLPPESSSSMLPVAIIGGAALLAILLSSKKAPTP